MSGTVLAFISGDQSDAALRLVMAAVLGAIVGLEREISDQPAGFRTHLTVALGAAVFGVISTLGFSEFMDDSAEQATRVDVTRVASNVVVGIGFLGAGVIFRAGSTVRNLTTAASLWVTAAIGLAAGIGNLGVAIGATAGMIFALAALRVPGDAIDRHLVRKQEQVTVTVAPTADPHDVIEAFEAIERLTVTRVDWAKTDGATVLHFRLQGDRGIRPGVQLEPVVDHPGVASLAIHGVQDNP